VYLSIFICRSLCTYLQYTVCTKIIYIDIFLRNKIRLINRSLSEDLLFIQGFAHLFANLFVIFIHDGQYIGYLCNMSMKICSPTNFTRIEFFLVRARTASF
jgi:hypothetical protein